MVALNPERWVHENPRFGEEEIKSLRDAFHLNKQESHLGYIEHKTSGERSTPNEFNKLLVAIITISASNADSQPGFSAMDNIVTDNRCLTTTYNATNLSFISRWGSERKMGSAVIGNVAWK